ncbi:hypothetical protein DFH08DRAFT_1018515 [Mycena albidolilacea]|uniref:J domain-containing protein n=1 Tax=Mycena albidolilacea TaxID=1033008 RepID=A0AAD7EMN8_9AGAR|nr:hypothetical protein DFH08DRAFT_1018515 [Mycena albidolilacea]
MDLYAVLDLAPGASSTEIKAAYHRALLAAHPDKNNAAQSAPDIAAIKDTYRVLSSPALRAKAKADQDPLRCLHPVQVISLADFDEHGNDAWMHVCWCGGAYAVTVVRMLLLGPKWTTGCISFRAPAAQRSFGWTMSWQRRSSAGRLRSDLRIIQQLSPLLPDRTSSRRPLPPTHARTAPTYLQGGDAHPN